LPAEAGTYKTWRLNAALEALLHPKSSRAGVKNYLHDVCDKIGGLLV
jgi:hypothetical protein